MIDRVAVLVVVLEVLSVFMELIGRIGSSTTVTSHGLETAVYMLHRVASLSVQAESADNATKQLDCCSDQFIQPQSSVQAA